MMVLYNVEYFGYKGRHQRKLLAFKSFKNLASLFLNILLHLLYSTKLCLKTNKFVFLGTRFSHLFLHLNRNSNQHCHYSNSLKKFKLSNNKKILKRFFFTEGGEATLSWALQFIVRTKVVRRTWSISDC